MHPETLPNFPTSAAQVYDSLDHVPAQSRPVVLMPGDGIGPEVSRAVSFLLQFTGAPVQLQSYQAGAAAVAAGVATGVPSATLQALQQHGIALKGPLETPIGRGAKSANVTLRKQLETFGNIRPICALPGLGGPFAGRNIDFVIVRENVEDTYAGIEHWQTPHVAQCLKLMTRTGCEKIVRLAFEVARNEGRTSVHCVHKANIMKATEGLLLDSFYRVATEYPDIAAKDMLVDNCAQQLVMRPEQFEVLVCSNAHGDILSDLAAGLVGGLGLAPSANIGHEVAIFEPVHGTAPDIAGQDRANPLAMLLAACMMLRHIGQSVHAVRLQHAIQLTLQDGIGTPDLRLRHTLGTAAFAAAIAERWQNVDAVLPPQRPPLVVPPRGHTGLTPTSVTLAGVDVFVQSALLPVQLAPALTAASAHLPVTLRLLSNRGTVCWPEAAESLDLVDHYRCRFLHSDTTKPLEDEVVLQLLRAIGPVAKWVHVEKLQQMDGKDGWSKAQGES
jgi:isocitrate dehydrogenase